MNYTVDQNNPRGSGVTYFHEHGHYIDDMAGGISKNIDIVMLLKDDIMRYEAKMQDKLDADAFDAIDTIISKELSDIRKHSAVSDLMDGATNGKIAGVSCHQTGYFSGHPEKLGQEAFAHVYESQFDQERRAQLRKYFPKTVDRIETLMKEMLR